MEKGRTIKNRVIKDQVRFIKTSDETDGAITWLSITLAPGGGNELHYHDKFAETFIARKGRLGVETESGILYLKEGEEKVIPKFQVHRFFNPDKEPIEFEVKIEPGSKNFEAFLQIMYGLAEDGKTNSKGIPKSLMAIGAVSQLGETLPPQDSLLYKLKFLFAFLSKRAERKGVLNQLKTKYVKY